MPVGRQKISIRTGVPVQKTGQFRLNYYKTYVSPISTWIVEFNHVPCPRAIVLFAFKILEHPS